jgi:septum formation inhibitor-activating ATPase MinD
MAPRKALFHTEDVKAKIKASQLINRLTTHALSEAPIMDASQVKAACALIDKVIPNMKYIEHAGPNGGPIRTEETGAATARLMAYLDAVSGRASGVPE